MICLRCAVDDIDAADDVFPPRLRGASYVTIHPAPLSELTNKSSGQLVSVLCDPCLAEAVVTGAVLKVDEWIPDRATVVRLAERAEPPA